MVTTNNGSNFSSEAFATISMVANCHLPEQKGPSMTFSSRSGIPAVPSTTPTIWAGVGPLVHFGAGEGPGVAGEVVVGLVAVGGVYGSVGGVAAGSTPGGTPGSPPPVGAVAGTVGTTAGKPEADEDTAGLPVTPGGDVNGGAGGAPHPANSSNPPANSSTPPAEVSNPLADRGTLPAGSGDPLADRGNLLAGGGTLLAGGGNPSAAGSGNPSPVGGIPRARRRESRSTRPC